MGDIVLEIQLKLDDIFRCGSPEISHWPFLNQARNIVRILDLATCLLNQYLLKPDTNYPMIILTELNLTSLPASTHV